MRSPRFWLVFAALLVAIALPAAAQGAHDPAAPAQQDKQKVPDQSQQQKSDQDKQKDSQPDKQNPSEQDHKNPTGPVTIAVQMPLRDGMRTVAGQVMANGKPWTGKVQVTVLQSRLTESRRRKTDPPNRQPGQANVSDAGKSDTQASGVTIVKSYVQKASAVSDDKGDFAVSLAQPLAAMQRVEVCAGEDLGHCAAETPEVSAATSWGRVRPYFAGGVVFSKENDDFSQQDLMLSFTLDNNWWQAGIDKDGKPAGRLFQQVNTFFDTRLTSVPVSTPTNGAKTTANGGGGGTTTTTDTFIQSRKAAVVQGGFYLPIYWSGMVWTHGSSTDALFLAPIAKIGVATTAAAQSTTTTATTGNQTSSTTTTSSSTKDLYRFYSIGFGLGHYKLANSKDNAPELISYLHFTFGKWENFEWNKWRLAVEGRLKIPEAPLQIGFDANVLPHGDGKGDLRIVFGTRFDIGEVIGKLHTF